MKDKLLYSAVGGCIGAVLTLTLNLFSPLVAQNDVLDAEFGTITCKGLSVMGDDDNALAYIGKWDFGGGDFTGGRLTLFNEFGKQIDLKADIYGDMTIYDGYPKHPTYQNPRFLDRVHVLRRKTERRLLLKVASLSGPEWWNMFIQSEHFNEDIKDIAREQLRRY